MISAVSNVSAFDRFCERDVFGTRIFSLFSVYGQNETVFKNSSFFVQENDTQITAALSLTDGFGTLSCTRDADFEEIREFLLFKGFSSLQCSNISAEKLGFPVTSDGFVVRFENAFEADTSSDKSKNSSPVILNSPYSADFKGVYSVLCKCDFDMPDYETWLADFSLRMRRGKSEMCTVAVDGKTVASASALFITDSAVLLGAVCTLPEFRGSGYAGENVTFLAKKHLSEGRRVELLCKEKLVPFYERLGLHPVGRWCSLTIPTYK